MCIYIFSSNDEFTKCKKIRQYVFCQIKEEIGSMGNTGMESHMFDFFISEILNKLGINKPNLLDKVFLFF